MKSELTKEDVIAIEYRKKELAYFKKLLYESGFFECEKDRNSCSSEKLWQDFFEKNRWIFGYGLSYIFLSGLNERKLEQVIKGFDLLNHGKRADAVLKTRGLISSICFAEIKTHRTPLLLPQEYRSGCYAPSKDLSGGIAQVQGTVASALDNVDKTIRPRDKVGNPTGEELYHYQPRSFLVIGSLEEFITDMGVNQDKFRSFELLRRNTLHPEIITFDELYHRASFIVEHINS